MFPILNAHDAGDALRHPDRVSAAAAQRHAGGADREHGVGGGGGVEGGAGQGALTLVRTFMLPTEPNLKIL